MERSNTCETKSHPSPKNWMVELVEDGSYEYIEQLFVSNDVYS